MHSNRRLALSLLVVASACCSASAAEWMTDLDAAKIEAQRLDRPILVHFYATWCGPCMSMEKNVLHKPAVLDQIDSSVVAVLIDVDKNKDLARRFDIQTLPTDIFLQPNGTRIKEMHGKHVLDDYLDSIASASTKYSNLVAERTPAPAAPEANVAAAESAEPPTKQASQEVMLLGYSPVALWDHRKWEKGSPQHAAEYRGQMYYMSSAKELEKFQMNMARYAPQFLGCDPVLISKDDRAVAGSTRYGAFYDEELYLFTSDANRKLFKSNPDRYVREKVVLNIDQIETVIR
jgi:YHS domain-containing protein/thiol-disulfide isomerase/thioredoxin